MYSMKSIFCFLLVVCSLNVSGQAGEYYILNSEINEFDILGPDEYETNLNDEQNINLKLKVQVGADMTSDTMLGASFIAKNTLDANMKTAWLTPKNGKNAQIEYVFTLQDNNLSSGTLFSIAVFNGWRKDYQTWNDFSRIKKVFITINDSPYAEVTLEDTYKLQYIDLDRKKLDPTRRYRIRFKILEIYPGKKYEQTALSDVQLIGKAK